MTSSTSPTRPSTGGGVAAVLYGVAAYSIFLATFLYAIGFVGNLWVPKTIDSGVPAPLLETLNVNLALLALFALQHSVMARPAFKRWWTRIVPAAMERSTYVLAASLSLLVLYWQWRPIATEVWSFGEGPARWAMETMFWLGWGTVLASTFMINHFELFGLRQVVARLFGRTLPPAEFKTPLFYRHVRHPIYLGFLVAFWATPVMTAGHLMFAIGTTGYILLGIYFEERDLVEHFGEQYARYRRQVRMLLPLPVRKREVRASQAISRSRSA
jgi:protein-S-isoprenylcysteine O-methyltransferase Ste14